MSLPEIDRTKVHNSMINHFQMNKNRLIWETIKEEKPKILVKVIKGQLVFSVNKER